MSGMSSVRASRSAWPSRRPAARRTLGFAEVAETRGLVHRVQPARPSTKPRERRRIHSGVEREAAWGSGAQDHARTRSIT